ncbi:hypothetical protein MBLNU459_g3435t1 [Dothideomycetes sp. NU459]
MAEAPGGDEMKPNIDEKASDSGSEEGKNADSFEDAPDGSMSAELAAEEAHLHQPSDTAAHDADYTTDAEEESSAAAEHKMDTPTAGSLKGDDGDHFAAPGETERPTDHRGGHVAKSLHMSTASMHNLAIGEPVEINHARSATLDSTPHLAPAVPSREHNQEPIKGLSGDLPALDFLPPPPPPPEKDKATPLPPPPARKVSSPFAWFSRATARKASSPTRNPEAAARRNTSSSVVTLTSNSENLEDGGPKSPTRGRGNSLKDRFQQLRLQEESGSMSTVDEVPSSPSSRVGRIAGIPSPTSEQARTLSPPALSRSTSFGGLPSPTSVKLPPGTASGMSVGPPEDSSAVNWDLWQSVVYEGPAAVARTSGEELNRAIASGIPQPIRGVVWQVLAESKNEDLEVMYRELVARGTDKEVHRAGLGPRSVSGGHATGPTDKEPLASSASSVHSDVSGPPTGTMPVSPGPTIFEENVFSVEKRQRSSKDEAAALQKLEKTIRRDLGARTSYSKYLASAGLQEGLFGLCKAYALFDEAMPEEEAFTLFVRLMSKYNLRSLFTAEMPGLHLRLYQFERLLEDHEPALYCHLHRRGVSPNLYATQWFLTLFAYRFPLQLVLRVYDLIFSEGLSAILRFGIVLMQKNVKTLLAMKDMAQLSTFLKEKLFDVYIDKSPSASSILESGFFGSAGGIDKEIYRADDLVRDACAFNIPAETLATYTSEFEERQRSEKDRETELETLRTNNTSLSTHVRTLEERAQQHDTEHVGIASELVRTKVENEALEDTNESLKTQVDELRKMVEAQPAEVEERLRAEMERIMKRNIEVQNENRALEETVHETEQELVNTKMMFAELNAEHEGLKQKLANIQSMLTER